MLCQDILEDTNDDTMNMEQVKFLVSQNPCTLGFLFKVKILVCAYESFLPRTTSFVFVLVLYLYFSMEMFCLMKYILWAGVGRIIECQTGEGKSRQ